MRGGGCTIIFTFPLCSGNAIGAHTVVAVAIADGQVLHSAAQDMLTRAHLEALYQCPLRELAVDGERCFVPGV